MSHPLIYHVFSSGVTLATVLDEGPEDVAAVVVFSHSPDIVGGDGRNCGNLVVI
jgi:hypothetical protein